MNDKERMAKAIAEMHDKLGHEKFNTVITIFMNTVESLKESGKDITFKDVKLILEDSIKIANVIYEQ